MKTTQEKIDHIMDYFDFAKVAKAMEALNWTWAGKGVPTEPELRKEARRLLNDVSNKNVCKCAFRYSISTGGFRVTKYHYGELELEFVVYSWASGNN
jgi:hypothetical protein